MKKVKRVFLIVLDSFGAGYLPDAEAFGDVGANTLKSIVSSEKYNTPNMEQIGLFNIDGIDYREGAADPSGSFGRLAEASMGKDTTTGHWEIAGLISEAPMPTYPEGFPEEVLKPFREQTGHGVLCNLPYSGTKVIQEYGEEHMRTGDLIVYTSADSVFQIAAHEEVVPLETLYEYCRIARGILQGKHGVGRVIARPFLGTCAEDFYRTRHRHDFSLIPPKRTMLVSLQEHGFDTYGVGKIYDIFAGQAVAHTVSMENNEDGMEKTLAWMDEDFTGLCFVNLVDFDMTYGHRRDIDGYANAATVFDRQLGQLMERMQEDDVVMITADHGCDPGFTGTDHTREYIPLLIYGKPVKAGVSIGTRTTFADIASTVLDMFGIDERLDGTSFWDQIRADASGKENTPLSSFSAGKTADGTGSLHPLQEGKGSLRPLAQEQGRLRRMEEAAFGPVGTDRQADPEAAGSDAAGAAETRLQPAAGGDCSQEKGPGGDPCVQAAPGIEAGQVPADEAGIPELIRQAIAAREKAYVPYSHFAVGAALQTVDGKVYPGCNIENAAYTPTNCAERSAFFTAVSRGDREFTRIAVVGGFEGEELQFCPPCGVCRQVMMEFCDPDRFLIILAQSPLQYEVKTLRELLPSGFGPEDLKMIRKKSML